MRALDLGVALEATRQTMFVTLGATGVLPGVTKALRWINKTFEVNSANQ